MSLLVNAFIIAACVTFGAGSAPTIDHNPHPQRRLLSADCHPTVVLIGQLPDRIGTALAMPCPPQSDRLAGTHT